MWEVRVFIKGEPESIYIRGTFKDHTEVEKHIEKVKPGCEFIWAVLRNAS